MIMQLHISLISVFSSKLVEAEGQAMRFYRSELPPLFRLQRQLDFDVRRRHLHKAH